MPLSGLTALDDPAGPQLDHPIERGGNCGVGDDERRAAGGKPRQLGQESGLGGRIEAVGGLVEHQDAGGGQQRTGEADAPRLSDRAFRFEQDVYRWIYTRRKIEVLNSNIDLHKILPEQFMPYPGPWIGPELETRIRKTVNLRSIFSPERHAYMQIRRTWRKDASAYAEQNCTNYMRFQTHWAEIAALAWQNEAMACMLRGQGMLNPTVAAHVAQARGMDVADECPDLVMEETQE